MRDEDKIKQIIMDELMKNGMDPKEYYIFVCYLDVKTVGVVGDKRSHSRPIMIEVRDIYTEAVAQLPMEILANISNRVTNEIEEPTKVVYDLTRFNGKNTYMEL